MGGWWWLFGGGLWVEGLFVRSRMWVVVKVGSDYVSDCRVDLWVMGGYWGGWCLWGSK